MTVLVTGATRGIGKAIAIAFAQAGYDVAAGCSSTNSLPLAEETAQQCREYGVKAQAYTANVADFAACEAMVKQVHADFGRIDALVNNAGITRDGLIARMSEQNFDDVIATNLKGAFNMIRHITPIMMKQRSGSIINISSVVGVNGNASQLNYAASKAGLIGMTKSAAKELGGRNIRCNAIAPGFIESEMTDVLPEELKKSMLGATSLKRFGTPQDVADTAVFLANHTFITGQVLVVDGGLQM